MKDDRRIYEKYKGYEAGGILKILTNKIGTLLIRLEANLGHSEQIDIHEWVGDWYYIIVKDTTIEEYPADSRCGFTVNVKTDEIMWVNTTTYNPHGGNCFVRTKKWKRFLRREYDITPEMVRDYTDEEPTKMYGYDGWKKHDQFNEVRYDKKDTPYFIDRAKSLAHAQAMGCSTTKEYRIYKAGAHPEGCAMGIDYADTLKEAIQKVEERVAADKKDIPLDMARLIRTIGLQLIGTFELCEKMELSEDVLMEIVKAAVKLGLVQWSGAYTGASPETFGWQLTDKGRDIVEV